MTGIQQRTVGVLERMARTLRYSRIEDVDATLERRAQALETLAKGVDQPCVVAVVGRVKTGKSTFINALLGEDLAVIGRTETTCSINYFRYRDSDPGIRCHWRDGEVTDVDQGFVEGLQGQDARTLHRAGKIHHLEYLGRFKRLRQVTLVDTPGTGAVVETHEKRTTDFIRLDRNLRRRHHQETERIGGEADAIIYLVGAEPRLDDRSFLERFREVTRGSRNSAFNALGVMSRIDINSEVLERRHELAATIAGKLPNELNTVLPVSAELERTLDRLGAGELRRLIVALREIPPRQLNMLLDDEALFSEYRGDCPVSVTDRRELLGSIEWSVFTTIARAAMESNMSTGEVDRHLHDVAGFQPLRDLLELKFFQRGPILRCHRILRDAEHEIRKIRYRDFNSLRDRELADDRRHRYRDFLRRTAGDRTVRSELEQLVEDHFTRGSRTLKQLGGELEAIRKELFAELQAHNADFQAWQELHGAPNAFTADEQAELRSLLGIDGLDVDSRLRGRHDPAWVRERMLHWRAQGLHAAHGSARSTVIHQVVVRYGLILKTLLE